MDTSKLNKSLPQYTYLNTSTADLEGELWNNIKPLDAVPEFFVVSNYGRVARVKLKGGDIKIMGQVLDKSDKLPRFKINRDWFHTHECVALSFNLPNPYGFKTVGHINGVKTDNRIENLEYVEMDSDDVISPYVLCDFTRIPSASASSTPVVKVNKEGTRLAAYLSVKEAAEREGKTPDKIFSLLRSENDPNSNVTWLRLRDYFKLPKFKEQASVITKPQNMKHPFMM